MGRERQASPCDSCAANRSDQLTRLGVDMSRHDYVVALAGNPNTGKSTVFNALTGLRQRTGNWPGKTVASAQGAFAFRGKRYKLVDLPGTYSLVSASADEEIARDFVLFGRPDVTVVVVDATRLERNLNLALQVLQISDRVVICLNLIDEAERHGLVVDHRRLARDLGVPVVATAARRRRGLAQLNEAIADVASGSTRGRLRRAALKDPAIVRAKQRVVASLASVYPDLPNADWVALRLLDGDQRLTEAMRDGQLGSLMASAAADTPHRARAPTRAEADAIVRTVAHMRWQLGPSYYQRLAESVYSEAARVADRAVSQADKPPRADLGRSIDRIVTSRRFGLPLMVVLLAVVFWITISGANYPSKLLSTLLIEWLHPLLKHGAAGLGMPWWLAGVLVDGVYLATAWVVSVMLPPMAIFFPLFTLLEDLGYLPRVAFNLDRTFKRVGAHGKQALTMAMGFGCNAAGVVATRIIESPRERLIAILTNNFALCNGRWPTQILIATIFIGALVPSASSLVAALAVVVVVVLGVLLTFGTSWMLSRTALRGEVSSFALELPPYRPPRLLQTLYTSMVDRTLFVLWRAVVFAAPAGAVIWLVGNVSAGGAPVAAHLIGALDPTARLFGLTGVILLAYIIAIPANEIVIPTILMLTALGGGVGAGAARGIDASAGVMLDLDVHSTASLLRQAGWTLETAVSLMLFSLIHNPCSTTIYTIWKETRSGKWTLVAALLPLVMGLVVCFFVAQLWRAV